MDARRENSSDYATKGDLEELRVSVNQDFKAALENSLERFSKGINQRIDQLEGRFDQLEGRFDQLEALIREKL